MAPAGIEETMAVMGDLQRVFESREDADRIVKIQRKCEEAMQLIAARERHMADVIAGKTSYCWTHFVFSCKAPRQHCRIEPPFLK